jgi:hypothetical protein
MVFGFLRPIEFFYVAFTSDAIAEGVDCSVDKYIFGSA